MGIKLTPSEITAAERCPEILRILADWRLCQQEEANATDMGTIGDANRAAELRAEADRIEEEY